LYYLFIAPTDALAPEPLLHAVRFSDYFRPWWNGSMYMVLHCQTSYDSSNKLARL